MSSTLIVHCDICGNHVTEQRTLLKVAAGPLRKRHHELDVCPGCLPGIEALLNGQPAGLVAEAMRGNGQTGDHAPAAPAAPEPEPEPEPTGRPKGKGRKSGGA